MPSAVRGSGVFRLLRATGAADNSATGESAGDDGFQSGM
jgi:hypothetical protein